MNSIPVPFSDLLNALSDWFGVSARVLPWRSEPSPYRVWISEIMLQQTVVAAVIPYFNRFIETFPDVGALAAADTERVLTLWSGLGYYSRARNLHRAAKILNESGFPQTRREWEALPGVGPYTAGAVLSIAFNQPEAILDGNIERVWSRFRCLPQSSAYKERLWQLSRFAIGETVRIGLQPSIVNQALMELGALVCRPTSPDCNACPLAPRCKARLHRTAALYPEKRRRAALKNLTETVYVYRLSDGRLWLPPSENTRRWRQGTRDFPLCENSRWRSFVRFAGEFETVHVVTNHKIVRTAKIYDLSDETPLTAAEEAAFVADLTDLPHNAACAKTFANGISFPKTTAPAGELLSKSFK